MGSCDGIFLLLLFPEGGLESLPETQPGPGLLPGGGDGLFLLPPDFPHQGVEDVVDVVAEGGGGFEEGAGELPGQVGPFPFGDLARRKSAA